MPSSLLVTLLLLQKLLSLGSPWPQQPPAPARCPRAPKVLAVPKGLMLPPIPPREEKKNKYRGKKYKKVYCKLLQ